MSSRIGTHRFTRITLYRQKNPRSVMGFRRFRSASCEEIGGLVLGRKKPRGTQARGAPSQPRIPGEGGWTRKFDRQANNWCAKPQSRDELTHFANCRWPIGIQRPCRVRPRNRERGALKMGWLRQFRWAPSLLVPEILPLREYSDAMNCVVRCRMRDTFRSASAGVGYQKGNLRFPLSVS